MLASFGLSLMRFGHPQHLVSSSADSVHSPRGRFAPNTFGTCDNPCGLAQAESLTKLFLALLSPHTAGLK